MSRTLVLNATYEALGLISRKRAICLVLADKAVVVEQSEMSYRSVSTSMPAPTIVRLKYFVKVPYRARTPLTRRAVLTRDHNECGYCGKHATTIDHIVPRSRWKGPGSANVWENVVACCRNCNATKDNKLLSELGWTLRIKPYQPSGTRWLILGLAELEPSWGPYLDGAGAVA